MSETNLKPDQSQERRSRAPAYLVRRHRGEHGPVYELPKDRPLGIGRASSNFIVLRDEGCSRHHAEVFYDNGSWVIRDLESLNGTLVNNEKIPDKQQLQPADVVAVGQSELVFVEDLSALDLGRETSSRPAGVGFTVRRRQDQTQILSISHDAVMVQPPSRNLQLLYRLALEMGEANDTTELANSILPMLLEATTAQCGGILRLDEENEPEPLGVHVACKANYLLPSQEMLDFVRSEKEAVLAEDIVPAARPGDAGDAGGQVVICAPVLHENNLLAIVHLYSTDRLKVPTSDDLDLAVAVAQQLGPVLHGLEQRITLSSQNQQLRESLRVQTELIGSSLAMQRVIEQIGMAAPTNATVLIRGESGVGKELVARSIHYSSQRSEGPFVCLNCAALPESLLESELFGHEKGAFTGATEKKRGKFEVAHQGTIFLDEVGELTPSTQSKLLRVLDGHPFERIGGDKPIRVNARVVAATNRDLERAVEKGAFREDLYYRLNVVKIEVPPLRERLEDVSLLACHFVEHFAKEMGRKISGCSPQVIERLTKYHWPGNVRELRNVIERTLVLTRKDYIELEDVGLPSWATPPEARPNRYETQSLSQMEADHIRNTLDHTDWNKSKAASILGIERSTLDRKIKRYDIVQTTSADDT